MTRLGADVEGLDAVAADLDRVADTVQRARATVDGQLARTRWVGPDADAFRGRWRRTGAVDLDQLRTALADAARELRRQSDQQRTASGEAVVHRGVGGVGSGSNHAHLLQPAAGAGALGLGVAGMALGAGGVGRAGAAGQLGGVAGSGAAGGPVEPGWLQGAYRVTDNLLTASGVVDRAGLLPESLGGGSSVLGPAGLALSVGAVGIRAGFERFNQERGSRPVGEAALRATATGAYRGTTTAVAAKVGGIAGAKGGAAVGAGTGFFIAGPAGAAAGAVVGGVIGAVEGSSMGSSMAETFHATSAGQQLEDAVADAASGAYDAAQRVSALATNTSGSVKNALTSAVPTATGALTSIGGSVRDKASTVGGLFSR